MTQQSIKAIETIYNGYRFRSRLEARWAVFFDTLGIKYEYEKEGYDLGEAGWYLPDFWLPDLNFWAEVKGQEPTDEELAKARYLVASSKAEHRLVFLQQIIETSDLVRWKHHVTMLTQRQLTTCGQKLKAFISFNFLENGSPFDKERPEFVVWRRCVICNRVVLTGTEGHNWNWTSCGCVERLLNDTYDYDSRPSGLVSTGLMNFLVACGLDGLTVDPDIAGAFDAARQARFEHGETPTIPTR